MQNFPTVVIEEQHFEAQFTWQKKGPFYEHVIANALFSTKVPLIEDIIQVIIKKIPATSYMEVPGTRVPRGTTPIVPQTNVVGRIQYCPFSMPNGSLVSSPDHDPSIPPENGVCLFQDLPSEVLRNILSASLPCRNTIIHPTCGSREDHATGRSNRLAELMLISKKTCFEVAEVVYQERTFGIHVHQGLQNAGIEFLNVGRQPLQYKQEASDPRFLKFSDGDAFGFCRLKRIDILIFPNQTNNRHTAINTYCMILALVRLLYRNGEDSERITMLRVGFLPSQGKSSVMPNPDSSWWDPAAGRPCQTSIHGLADIELVLHAFSKLVGVHNVHIELPTQLKTHNQTVQFVEKLEHAMMSTDPQPQFAKHSLEFLIEVARNALENHILKTLYGGSGTEIPKLNDADWNVEAKAASKDDSDDDDDGDSDDKPFPSSGGVNARAINRLSPVGGSSTSDPSGSWTNRTNSQQFLPFHPNPNAVSGRVGSDQMNSFCSSLTEAMSRKVKVGRFLSTFGTDQAESEYWVDRAGGDLERAGRMYRGEEAVPTSNEQLSYDEEQDIAMATAASLESVISSVMDTFQEGDDFHTSNEEDDMRRAIEASIESAVAEMDKRNRSEGEDSDTQCNAARGKKRKMPKPYEGKGKGRAIGSDDDDDDNSDKDSPDAPAPAYATRRRLPPMQPRVPGSLADYSSFGEMARRMRSLSATQRTGSSRPLSRHDSGYRLEADYNLTGDEIVPIPEAPHRPLVQGPAPPSTPVPVPVPSQSSLTRAQYEKIMGGSATGSPQNAENTTTQTTADAQPESSQYGQSGNSSVSVFQPPTTGASSRRQISAPGTHSTSSHQLNDPETSLQTRTPVYGTRDAYLSAHSRWLEAFTVGLDSFFGGSQASDPQQPSPGAHPGGQQNHPLEMSDDENDDHPADGTLSGGPQGRSSDQFDLFASSNDDQPTNGTSYSALQVDVGHFGGLGPPTSSFSQQAPAANTDTSVSGNEFFVPSYYIDEDEQIIPYSPQHRTTPAGGFLDWSAGPTQTQVLTTMSESDEACIRSLEATLADASRRREAAEAMGSNFNSNSAGSSEATAQFTNAPATNPTLQHVGHSDGMEEMDIDAGDNDPSGLMHHYTTGDEEMQDEGF